MKDCYHRIELDTTVPHAHQVRCWLNLHYVIVIKQNIDKSLDVGFIKPIKEATTWLSPIMVIPKKNGKLKIYVDFKNRKVLTKEDSYLLPFTDEVINIVIGHEVYTFLNGFLRYHQISITL
jgi:hypothetical protein